MSHFRRGAGYSSGNYGALGANTGEPRGAGAGVSDSVLPIPNLPGNRAYNPRVRATSPPSACLVREGGGLALWAPRRACARGPARRGLQVTAAKSTAANPTNHPALGRGFFSHSDAPIPAPSRM